MPSCVVPRSSQSPQAAQRQSHRGLTQSTIECVLPLHAILRDARESVHLDMLLEWLVNAPALLWACAAGGPCFVHTLACDFVVVLAPTGVFLLPTEGGWLHLDRVFCINFLAADFSAFVRG